jgi:hypothetical protein
MNRAERRFRKFGQKQIAELERMLEQREKLGLPTITHGVNKRITNRHQKKHNRKMK